MHQLPDIIYGDNTPYTGRLKNDCLYRHGTQNGLAHALIELRQDEIETPAAQAKWAAHMVAILREAASMPALVERNYIGSIHDAGKAINQD
jgi:predicted N-formylglutamate amidohydrolase